MNTEWIITGFGMTLGAVLACVAIALTGAAIFGAIKGGARLRREIKMRNHAAYMRNLVAFDRVEDRWASHDRWCKRLVSDAAHEYRRRMSTPTARRYERRSVDPEAVANFSAMIFPGTRIYRA